MAIRPLNYSRLQPITPPDPAVRQKTLADAQAMQQQSTLRDQAIQQGQAQATSQQATAAKQQAIQQALDNAEFDPTTGTLSEKTIQALERIDPVIGSGLRKSYQDISTSKAKTAFDEKKVIYDTEQDRLKNELEGNKATETARHNREAEETARIAAEKQAVPPQRNIDPNSPEGIAARLDFDRKRTRTAPAAGEPLLPTTDPVTGETTYTPRSQAAGMKVPVSSANKPSTGVEKRVLSFYIRAKDADENVKEMEPQIQKLSTAGQVGLEWLPNMLQTELGGRYRQAQRAFTEARLRKDSGAAIPPHEYENDAKTYFAVPGDDAARLEQKRKGRAAVMEGLQQESGRAYKEHYGEDPKPGGKKDPLNIR